MSELAHRAVAGESGYESYSADYTGGQFEWLTYRCEEPCSQKRCAYPDSCYSIGPADITFQIHHDTFLKQLHKRAGISFPGPREVI